jgi:hypothetical protein
MHGHVRDADSVDSTLLIPSPTCSKGKGCAVTGRGASRYLPGVRACAWYEIWASVEIFRGSRVCTWYKIWDLVEIFQVPARVHGMRSGL